MRKIAIFWLIFCGHSVVQLIKIIVRDLMILLQKKVSYISFLIRKLRKFEDISKCRFKAFLVVDCRFSPTFENVDFALK